MTADTSLSYTLDSHEMRCLSVLKPMAFLMAVEYDLFLAATHAGQQPLEVQFPAVSSELKKALLLCAARFNLKHNDVGNTIVISGVAQLPLLRYVDFLPGQLHLDEVLSVANIKFTKTEPKKAPTATTDSKFAFVAAAIQYDVIGQEEPKFEAVSFFLTIDAGLPLASMGHLLRFEVPAGTNPNDAVKSFQRFSHWNKFDLRWDDEQTKVAGVIVLPSTTDVHELFERYEDEDTGDDATLLFRLRPIGACAHVPYLEDALLRRIRDQAWKDVLGQWAASPHARNGLPTIAVSGFHPATTLDELLHVIDKAHVVDATMVVEDTPSKRRKLYVNLGNADAVRTLLGQDGYRASQLSGKPNLRISVSPPYFAESRRGHVIMSVGLQGTRSPSPQPEYADPAESVATAPAANGRGKKQAAAAGTASKKDSPQPAKKDNSRSPQASSTTPPVATTSPSTTPRASAEPAAPAGGRGKGAKAPAAAATEAPKGRGSPQAAAVQAPPAEKPGKGPKATSSPQAQPVAKPAAAATTSKAAASTAAPAAAEPAPKMERANTADSDAPMERQATAEPSTSEAPKSKLNKAAAPFVPMGSPIQTFSPPPPPPSMPPPYSVAAPGQAGLPPPPYVPPPPTYMQTTTSPATHMVPHNPVVMPPAYSLSPPAYASMPPPYSKTPGGRPAPPPYVSPVSSMGSPIGSEATLPPPSTE